MQLLGKSETDAESNICIGRRIGERNKGFVHHPVEEKSQVKAIAHHIIKGEVDLDDPLTRRDLVNIFLEFTDNGPVIPQGYIGPDIQITAY